MKKCFLFLLLLCGGLLTQAQKVGIGTSNPSRAKLDVHGAVGTTSAIFGGEGNGISVQRAFPSIGFNQYYNGASRYMANGYAGVQYLDPNTGFMMVDLFANGLANNVCSPPQRVLTISNSGNVAFGPNYTNSSLTVSRTSGVNATAFFFGTTHNSAFNYGTAENTYIRAGRDYGTVYLNYIAGSKTVFTGPVGINTATPGSTLEIRQQDGKGMLLVESNGSNNWEFVVGTPNPNFYLRHNGVVKGYFKNADGTYVSTSDRRLKTNIQPLSSILDKVLQLQPVSYQMVRNNPQYKQSIGFIAQDVKTLFPELVMVSADTTGSAEGTPGLHALDYSGFGVLAVKAAQEHQQLIGAQEHAIAALDKGLQALQKKVDGLVLCRK